jgi:uncharacterized protein (DUF2126 family)
MGYRLPLDSQPWTAKSDYPYVNPPDAETADRSAAPATPPSVARPGSGQDEADGRGCQLRARRLPMGFGEGKGGPGEKASVPTSVPGSKESAGWITRMAMSAEPRDGKLYIFMPPTNTLDDYLELVAAVEATAEECPSAGHSRRLRAAVDPRLTSFRVTPDPGVIEVNIHPAHSWDQLVEQTTHLYDAAHSPA